VHENIAERVHERVEETVNEVGNDTLADDEVTDDLDQMIRDGEPKFIMPSPFFSDLPPNRPTWLLSSSTMSQDSGSRP